MHRFAPRAAASPDVSSHEATPALRDQPIAANGPTSLRVLVIDDNRAIADTLAEILRTRGYEATAVYSTAAALVFGKYRRPDAVITELFSQRSWEGLQLAIRLADAFPVCKVILTSTNVKKATRFLDSGITGHRFPVVRTPIYPVEIPQFVAAVEAILLP